MPVIEKTGGQLRPEQHFLQGLAQADQERQPSTAGEVHLSPRQLQVLNLMARGLTHSEIGAELHIAGYTAINHVVGVRDAFGVSSGPRRFLERRSLVCLI